MDVRIYGRILPAIRVIRLTTVEPVIFLYMTAAFVQFPSFQDLIYSQECAQVFQDDSQCDSNHDGNNTEEAVQQVQERTSLWLLYTNAAATVAASLTVSIILGPVGDKYGRKLPILMPIIGSILGNVVNLLVSIFPSLHVSFLLIGSFVDGIFGGYIAILMSIFGYIGHIASSNNKTTHMAVNVAMIYIAGTVGYLIHGYIIDKTNFVVVFSVAIGILLLAFIYAIIFVENVKPVEADNSQREIACNYRASCFLDNVIATWKFVKRRRRDRATFFLTLFIIAMAIIMLCTTGQNDVMLLYTKLPTFAWKQTTYGIFRAGENLFQGVAVLLLLPLLKFYFNVQDLAIILAGLISRIVSVCIVAVANESWHLYMSAFVGILHAFPASGIRSCMSSLVAQNEQGTLFGIVASIESISALLATLIFNKMYPATLKIYDGSTFLLAAFLQMIAFFIIVWVHAQHGDNCKNYQYSSFRSEGSEVIIQNEDLTQDDDCGASVQVEATEAFTTGEDTQPQTNHRVSFREELVDVIEFSPS